MAPNGILSGTRILGSNGTALEIRIERTSMQDFARTFEDLVGRLDGPFHFRFIFQPLMAAVLAVRDGRRDAHEGRTPFRAIIEPRQRREGLVSSWKSVSKVFFMALIIDAFYQFKVRGRFYPGQALLVALFLAIVPYLLLRGPVNWLATWEGRHMKTMNGTSQKE